MRNIPNTRHLTRIFVEHPRDRHKLALALEAFIASISDKIFDDTLNITWFAAGDMSPLLYCSVEWDEEQDTAPTGGK